MGFVRFRFAAPSRRDYYYYFWRDGYTLRWQRLPQPPRPGGACTMHVIRFMRNRLPINGCCILQSSLLLLRLFALVRVYLWYIKHSMFGVRIVYRGVHIIRAGATGCLGADDPAINQNYTRRPRVYCYGDQKNTITSIIHMYVRIWIWSLQVLIKRCCIKKAKKSMI